MTSASTPAITVGIMTHNYGRYIREAIDSVLAQSRTDWELIVSDDASTDGTEQFVTPYLADPRISYVRHPENLGQAGNWGFLLAQGTAPIIAILHADDSWLPGTLETALSAFAAEPDLDMFYGNWWRQTEGQPDRVLAKQEKPHVFSGYEEYKYQIVNNTCLSSAAFLTRRVTEAAGRPHPELKMMVDGEYFLRVCANARKVQAVQTPLMLYRVHSNSTTAVSTTNGVYIQEREKFTEICSLWADTPRLRTNLRDLEYQQAKGIFSEGVAQVVNGKNAAGLDLLCRAIKLRPLILLDPKIMLDYLLCKTGTPGFAFFRLVHRARFRQY
jgi:glycosyltransferase involved in cell wall biosynthesis